jgi:predicted nucleic acid-binding Zn ribbon protein
LQKITDKPIGTCPSCGKRGLKRLVSAPVFRLKGSGWYETDFKSDQENKRNLVGSEAEPKSEAKADTKADTKAETTAEPKAETKAETKSEPNANGKANGKAEGKAESKPAASSSAAKNNRKSTPVRRGAPASRKHK